jgi:hypothetical protein
VFTNQNFVNSSSICQTSSQGLNPVSAFFMGWVQRVSRRRLYSFRAHDTGLSDALFYDVYTRLAELHLLEIGLDTVWREVRVGEEVDEQWGTTRKYFTMPWYRLPVCCLETL